MAKRFIDTELFCDEWFCDLSKDSKLFFIYFITRCDHAGVLRLNNKLCEFQTGIKSIDTVIKDLGNCLVTVKNGVYFLPKYIKYQYPDFPKSSVKQQDSALKILISFGLWDEENNKLFNSSLTVNEELTNSYVIVNVNDNVNETDSVNVLTNKDIFLFFKNEKFKSTWKDFSDMRKRIKKPMTPKAEELTVKELEKFSDMDVEIAILILEKSIQNSWQGVFPLKDNTYGKKNGSNLNTKGLSTTIPVSGGNQMGKL